MRSGHIQHGIPSVFSSLVLVLLAAVTVGVVVLWGDTNDLQRNVQGEAEVFSSIPADEPLLFEAEEALVDDVAVRMAYVEQRVFEERERLIADGQSFIDVDLVSMELRVYENGAVLHEFPVVGKGRMGTWWETPPGRYVVENRLENHFSSIWDVWMPYSIQFYGNFFIHGWPSWADGTPLSAGPSGGCIRMRTEDARVVFRFAEAGMPLLVYEHTGREDLPLLTRTGRTPYTPSISAPHVLVADFDTRHLLFDSRAHEAIPAGSLSHMVLALTAAESVALERSISLRSWMIAGMQGERLLEVGRSYRAFDLLYPLLMRSSDEAGVLISYFLTPEAFLGRMNTKVRSLGMDGTMITDFGKEPSDSVTTLSDGARLMRYVLDLRSFLFGVGRGVYYPQGVGQFTTLENAQLFHDDPALVGVVSGGEAEESIVLTIWSMRDSSGTTRHIFVGLAHSDDALQDMHEVHVWLEHQFGLTPIESDILEI